MNKRMTIFLFTITFFSAVATNAWAGTDIINGLLIKAGNVVDKIALKYQEISLKINELTEGKMFNLDATTSDLIRSTYSDYLLIQSKIAQIRSDVEGVKSAFHSVDGYFYRIKQRIEEVDSKAKDLLEKRGWFVGNDDDEEDDDELSGSVTAARTVSGFDSYDDNSNEDNNDSGGRGSYNNFGRGSNSRTGNNEQGSSNDNSYNKQDYGDSSGNNELQEMFSSSQSIKRSFITDDDNVSDNQENTLSQEPVNQMSEKSDVKK